MKKKKKQTHNTGVFNEIPYESNCELDALKYFFELKSEKYVINIKRGETFLLCDTLTNTYAEQLKRGSKTVTQTIQLGASYTYDFTVFFTEKAIGKFVWDIDSHLKYDKKLLVGHKLAGVNGKENLYVCHIEVKPDFNANTTPKSVLAMKWLFHNKKIFVNLFKPLDRFEKTFMPKECLLTKMGKPKKLKFKPKLLQQYLKTR